MLIFIKIGVFLLTKFNLIYIAPRPLIKIQLKMVIII